MNEAKDAPEAIKGRNLRAFPRHPIHAAIQISIWGEGALLPATINNYSKDGLYFVTPASLREGTLIDIESPIPGLLESDAACVTGAKAIWSGKLSGTRAGYYEVGAKWLTIQCDGCHEQMPLKRLHRTRESLVFCPLCREAFEKSANGLLKHSLYRHLLGNIT